MRVTKVVVIVLAVGVGCLGLAGSVHAAMVVVNVDFQPGPTGDGAAVGFVGQGAYSDPGNDTWNVMAPPTDGAFNSEKGSGGPWAADLTSGVLVDSSGGATSVTVTLTADVDNTAAYAANPVDDRWVNIADDAKDLMREYLIASSFTTQSISIDNLGSGAYDLYLYGTSHKTGGYGTTFTIGEASKSTAGVPGGAHNLTVDVDYVVFTGLIPTDGSIAVDYIYYRSDSGSNNSEGLFNGFQLISIGTAIIPGDANRDNIVNDQDASILAAHWQQTGMGWGDGDFNNDGVVNDQDASILAAHWQETAEGGAPVPEPSTLMLVGTGLLGLVGLLVRRRGGAIVK